MKRLLLTFFIPVVASAQSIPKVPRADNLVEFLRDIIQYVILPFGVPIAAVFIIYSGFLFISARGNHEKIKRAKETFLWTIIGTAILLGIWVIVAVISGTVENLMSPT